MSDFGDSTLKEGFFGDSINVCGVDLEEHIRQILEISKMTARASPEEIEALIKMSPQEISQTITKLQETGVIGTTKAS